MNNETVAHKWAHNQSGNSGNMTSLNYSDRELGIITYLNSYNTTIGVKFATFAILPYNQHWSNTTSRHLSYAHRALSGRVILLPMFDKRSANIAGRWGQDEFRAAIIGALIEKIKKLDDSWPTAGIHSRFWSAKHITEALDLLAELLVNSKGYSCDDSIFHSRFGIPTKDQKTEIKQALKKYASYAGAIDEIRVEAAEAEARKEAEAAEKLAKRREKDADQFNDWLAGDAHHCPDSYKVGGAYLRCLAYQVETSLGVVFPLEDLTPAFRLYDRLDNGDGTWKPWKRNGEKVLIGGFNLDSITESGGAVAGCHRVSRDEIKRFRAAYGI